MNHLDCPFCQIIAGTVVAPARYEGHFIDYVTFEPINPVTFGHTLVVPKRHVEDAGVDYKLTGRMFEAAGRTALRNAVNAPHVGTRDYNLIVNKGPSAGQTVNHLHVHIVPRSPNDGLQMPWDSSHTTSTDIETMRAYTKAKAELFDLEQRALKAEAEANEFRRLTGREDGTPVEAREMINALSEAASQAEAENDRLAKMVAGLLETEAKERGALLKIAALPKRTQTQRPKDMLEVARRIARGVLDQ